MGFFKKAGKAITKPIKEVIKVVKDVIKFLDFIKKLVIGSINASFFFIDLLIEICVRLLKLLNKLLESGEKVVPYLPIATILLMSVAVAGIILHRDRQEYYMLNGEKFSAIKHTIKSI